MNSQNTFKLQRKMEARWLALAVLATLLAILFIRWLINFCVTVYRLPPGPWGLPVFGYLPWLSDKAFRDFALIGKKYGGLFSVGIGSDMAVVFNDWPAVKAAFVDRGRTFGGRKVTAVTRMMTKKEDVIFNDGEVWRKQRNLAVKSIKNVGMHSKKSFEDRFTDTIHQMTEELRKLDGQTINLEELIKGFVAQGNWNLISYINVAESKEELEMVMKDVDVMMEIVRFNYPVNALPWLRFLPPRGFGFWQGARTAARLRKNLKELIGKHHQQLDSGNDVIDNYIELIKQKSTRSPPYNDDHLLGTVMNLIIASMETTLSSIMWGLLYLGLNPRVQAKIQEELDRVVGGERLLVVEDFPRLPYLDAFVMEVHRMGSVVPLAVPHSTLKTVHLNGFVIPKDTLCILNIYAVHHDPNYWAEPEVFRPERFITPDGAAKAPPYLIPFSVGPRVCLGQAVAETEMRLVFGTFLQHFTFSLPIDRPQPSLEPHISLTQKPQPFSMQIQCRNLSFS